MPKNTFQMGWTSFDAYILNERNIENTLTVFSGDSEVSKTVLKSFGGCLIEMEQFLSSRIPTAVLSVSIHPCINTYLHNHSSI